MKGRIPNKTGVNLEVTFKSGQCFSWGNFDEEGRFEFGIPSDDGYWEGVVYGVPFRLLAHDRYIYYRAPAKSVFVPQLGERLNIEDFLSFYLRLDTNLGKIYKEIARDRYIKEAIERFNGLTILRQNPFETLVSYMISPQNSVEKIAQKLNEISLVFGKFVIFEGKRFPVFPSPEDFLNNKEKFLDSGLKLRFGEKQKLNILRAIELVSGSEHGIFDVPHKDTQEGGLPGESPKELEQTRFDINRLFGRPYREVINTLLKIKGVGRKIADCVALFSLEKLEAVPLDVHIKRVTRSLYGGLLGEKPRGVNEYEFIGDFWRRYFGRYAGFAQEFLYMYSREGLLR